MDPNVSLARIRELVHDVEIDPCDPNVAAELAETITGLDGWLSRGGFLPYDWFMSTPTG